MKDSSAHASLITPASESPKWRLPLLLALLVLVACAGYGVRYLIPKEMADSGRSGDSSSENGTLNPTNGTPSNMFDPSSMGGNTNPGGANIPGSLNSGDSQAMAPGGPQTIDSMNNRVTSTGSSAANASPPDSPLPMTITLPTPGVRRVSTAWRSPGPPADIEQAKEEGKELMQILVDMFPKNPDIWEVKARLHSMLGESEEASECWKRALAIDPNYGFASLGLGQLAIKNADYEMAEEWLRKAMSVIEHNDEVVQDLSTALIQQGKVDESISILKSYVDANPQSAVGYLLLGQSYSLASKYREASEAFRAALARNANIPKAQIGLGQALIRLDQPEEAEKWFEKARLEEEKELAETSPEEDFKKELKAFAVRYVYAAQVLHGLGQATMDQRLFEDEEEILRRAALYDKDSQEVRVMQVKLYPRLQRPQEAIAAAKELVAMMPSNPSYYFTLGILAAQQEDTDTAKAAFQKVTELAPDQTEGYSALAKLHLKFNLDDKLALQYAEKAVQLHRSPDNFEMYSAALERNGQISQAISAIETAVQLDPNNPNYRNALLYLRNLQPRESK